MRIVEFVPPAKKSMYTDPFTLPPQIALGPPNSRPTMVWRTVAPECPAPVAAHLLQVRTYGVEAAVVTDSRVRAERGEQIKARLWTSKHCHSNGMVERDHRALAELEQHVIQRGDLGPVGGRGGRGFVMDGGDRCLELVGPGGTNGEGAGDQSDTFRNFPGIPHTAVLLSHRDQGAVRSGAGQVAGVDEQHQSE